MLEDKETLLLSYIDEVFMKYDLDKNGELDSKQMTAFFNDLFRSLNMDIQINEAEAIETIREIDQDYNGLISKKQLYQTFVFLLGWNDETNNSSKNSNFIQQRNKTNQYVQQSNNFVPTQITNSYLTHPVYQVNPYTHSIPQQKLSQQKKGTFSRATKDLKETFTNNMYPQNYNFGFTNSFSPSFYANQSYMSPYQTMNATMPQNSFNLNPIYYKGPYPKNNMNNPFNNP